MIETTIVRGSYGSLTVHNNSGQILSRDQDGPEYDDIIWFDPARLPRYPWGECDILDCAFANDKGVYTRELGHNGQEWTDNELLSYHHQ